MNPARIDVFDLAKRRLDWVERRQTVLARNIANVSTPAFQPRDLPPFTQALGRAIGAAPAQTRPGHLNGTLDAAAGAASLIRPVARAPDGNAVSLDEQLSKVAETQTTQAMVTTIYRKYLGLFGLALGRTP